MRLPCVCLTFTLACCAAYPVSVYLQPPTCGVPIMNKPSCCCRPFNPWTPIPTHIFVPLMSRPQPRPTYIFRILTNVSYPKNSTYTTETLPSCEKPIDTSIATTVKPLALGDNTEQAAISSSSDNDASQIDASNSNPSTESSSSNSNSNPDVNPSSDSNSNPDSHENIIPSSSSKEVSIAASDTSRNSDSSKAENPDLITAETIQGALEISTNQV